MQISGTSIANIAEVDSNTKAIRTSIRPMDYGALGDYSSSAASGTMSAALSANSPIYACRFAGTSNLMLLRKLMFSAGNTATAFTAGLILIQVFFARSFTVADTGGTAVTPTTGGNKKRTTMASTGVADLRISSTGTLTAGTRTLDAQPFMSFSGSIPAVAGTPLVPLMALSQAGATDYPETFAASEGFVIQATVPATGTWQFSVQSEWDEIIATSWY